MIFFPFLATVTKQDTRHSKKINAKKRKGILRSKNYPVTSKISKTTMKGLYDRDKSPPYVPFGTGSSTRNIGDKTSFNVFLNGDQVRMLYLVI